MIGYEYGIYTYYTFTYIEKDDVLMGKNLKGKELGKGIYQRKDGKYSGRFEDRFGKRREVYGTTLKEVKNKLALAIADNTKLRNVVEPSTTLDEWYEKWMRVYKVPVIRANSKRHYETVYTKHIKPYLGNKKLTEITKLMVTDTINQVYKKGYQWETLNKIRVLLIDMLNRAMEDDFLVKNPAKGVRLPVNRPQSEAKALTREDQADFFECSAGTFYYNLFVVAINTGLRPGELFALTEKDIDLEKNEIKVTKTLLYQKLDGDEQKEFHIEEPKTKSSYRTVPINSFCKEALQKQIVLHKLICNNSPKEELEFPDLLFTTKFGTPLNSQIYMDAIKRIVDEVNLMRDPLDAMEKFSGHSFRHTFATRCFEAGIPPKTVQAYLGHASLQMTMDLYTSVLEKKKVDDMKLLEDTIGLEKTDSSSLTGKIIQFGA